MTRTALLAAFAILALLSACTVDRSPDLAAYRASTVAHELGHAGGLDHSTDGLMVALWDGNQLPTAADWAPAHRVDCLNWGVPDDLRGAFEAAAEAWCVASDGEFCPWIYDNADATSCLLSWAELDRGLLGLWSPHRIQISTTLK